ncbi:hypothetical protein JCM16303_005404 [Sporobolomyces ruberrimus]
MTGKKQQDLEQGEGSSLLPSPPPYTVLPSASGSNSSPLPSAPLPPPSRPLQSHPQGPSPFSSLPLPQTSPYAHERQLAQADRRARRRFFAALCWAGIIYLAIGILSGAVVGFAIGQGGTGEGDGGHGHKHRGGTDRDRDWDWATPTSEAIPIQLATSI